MPVRLFSFASIDMSLFASLDVANPIASQSGALIAPVKPVDLGCNTGTSTHLQNTIVQTGLGRKSKRSKTRRVRKNKKTGKTGKTGKRKYKRTMNRRRKRSRSGKTKSSRKSTRKNKRVRVNQVGRGSSYTNVLTPMDGMGRHAARSDVALVQTGPVAATV